MAKKKVIKVGIDLDGVVAKHSLGGFWFWLRREKEKLLRKADYRRYYYPSTVIEKTAWQTINWLRTPSVKKDSLFTSLAAREGNQFYLVTSRFKFLERMTLQWLKRYGLFPHFHQIMMNVKDEDPLPYKDRAIKKLGLEYFIDDDLEVIDYLKKRSGARLFWVVPGHRNPGDNHHSGVETCEDLSGALKKIFRV